MKQIKRWVSFLMVLCMAFSMVPVTAYAVTDVASGPCGENLTWILTDDGTLTISGEGAMTDYSSGSTPWYDVCNQIRTVYIESGVSHIGYCAFDNCTNLSTVHIPESVVSISGRAFSYCENLKEILIPDSVTTIGHDAFANCINLIEVEIPDSITSIAYGAFRNCTSLSSVVLPERITSIDENTFMDCTSLLSVTFGKSVTNVGDYAFANCTSLTSIDIPDSVVSIDGISAFENCTNLTDVRLGNSIAYIADYAFYKCENLKTIRFSGNAPVFGYYWVYDENITIFYPADNETWTNEVMENIEVHDGRGYIEWVPYDLADNDEEADTWKSVRYFAKWDSENQIAYFDSDPSENPANQGSQVTEETDTSFLENVDQLVGHYVLAETKARDDGMIAPDTLISIKPVETYTGNITEIGDSTISIDGVSYPVAERLYPLFFSVGDLVIYHLYDGEIVGISEYDGESPVPGNPDIPDPNPEPEPEPDPEPVYELVLTPEGDTFSIEIGQALEFECELYCDDVRVEEWEQPQLSISYTDGDSPISYEGWQEGWTGSYKLNIEGVAEGEAYLTISDSSTEAAVTICIEVLPLDETEFDDRSKAEWITTHIQYAKSDEYKEQVVNGFSGTLNTAFEEIRDDWTIGFYSTLDKVNTILDLDINGMSETQEYELLLVQILFARNGVVSIEETYSNYLSESSLDILKKMLNDEDFIAGIDDQKLSELSNQLNDLNELGSLINDSVDDNIKKEFNKKLKALLNNIEGLNIEIKDSVLKNVQDGLGLVINLSLEQLEDYCDTTSECIMFLAAGEAYARTSDTFGQMLLKMRSHLDIPSNLDGVNLEAPLFSEETFLTVLDRETTSLGNRVIASNPFDIPVNIAELSRAIENFYTQMESYEKDYGITIAQKAADSMSKDTAWNVFGTVDDVVMMLFEASPVVKLFDGIKSLFDGTQFVIKNFTGIDEREYHGTMVMRLYCMAMIHYATVNSMAETTENWGMIPADGVNHLEPVLDRNEQYDDATIFDEAVAFYRAIRAVATEYANAYYRTPILEAPNQPPCGPFRTLTEMEADLYEEQSMLDYEWCHEEYKGVILDPNSLITFGLKCPINITVLNEDDTLIAELDGGIWTVTPGYEAYFTVTEIGDNTGEFFKTVTVPRTYTVSISGTNDGEMDAVVLDDHSENAAYFLDVPIAANTTGTFIVDSEKTGVLAELEIDGVTFTGETDVHVHEYAAPVFSWTEAYECTATFICVEDDDSQTAYCMVTSETISATEADEGSIIYIATTKFAGQTYTDTKTVVIPATGHVTHTTTLVPAVDATCVYTGNVAYYTCSGCDLWFEDAKATKVIEDHSSVFIPLADHRYESIVTTPTCTEQGYTTHTCPVCGDSYVDSYVEAIDHNYENGVCTECDEVDPNYEEPADPSDPSETVPSVPVKPGIPNWCGWIRKIWEKILDPIKPFLPGFGNWFK